MAYASARLSLPAAVSAETRRQERPDTRLRQRSRRHKGLLSSPTSYVVASEDASWLDDAQPVAQQAVSGPVAREVAEKSHLQWTKTLGRHGESRPSTSTYIGTLRLAFGAGTKRAIEGDIPSWAERGPGDLSIMVQRVVRNHAIGLYPTFGHSQSVEQMLGVLAQHRRSLEEISESFPEGGKSTRPIG